MFRIKKYTREKKREWNDFVARSKNGTFLFDRGYMDYHSDRFEDFSLMVYRKNKLYVLLPANKVGNTFFSHQGLTYGGYIMSNNVSAAGMIETVRAVHTYLLSEGLEEVVYKAIPYIYHLHPAEEDLYAFFRCCDVKTIGCNISSTIIQANKLKFETSRQGGIRKALGARLIISESRDFSLFWAILQNNLEDKYGAQPVHTIDEITLLGLRFPQNIKLYLVYKDETVIGGTVLYISKQVVHVQYISTSQEGKEFGALDLLFDFLINEKYTGYPYFDFGQSTEEMGLNLNENLIFQKEGFGARGLLYNIYKWFLCNVFFHLGIENLDHLETLIAI